MGSLLTAKREMKSVLLLCLGSLSVQALVLPLQLHVGGNKTPALKSIETCPGHENDVMVVIEGTTDEEICMPGTSHINVHTRVSEDQPCGCPLLKGEFILEGVEAPVQDMGPILGAVMEGDYEATATLYGAGNKEKILGCMKLTFALKQC